MSQGEAPRPAHLSRLAIGPRSGIHSVHRQVYAACRASIRPLWRRCSDYALVLSTHPAEGCPSRLYDPSPETGGEVRFDLIAEVNVARKRNGGTRGVRADPILEARIADRSIPYSLLARSIGSEWIARQGLRHGFEILVLEGCDYEPLEFRREDRMVRIATIAFRGRLRITEAVRFREAMLCWIGHGKAWGLGLLLCFRT